MLETKTNAYEDLERRWKEEWKILFSHWGQELQLNLIAQGYEEILINRLMACFPVPIWVIKVLHDLRKEIEND